MLEEVANPVLFSCIVRKKSDFREWAMIRFLSIERILCLYLFIQTYLCKSNSFLSSLLQRAFKLYTSRT